MSEHTLLVEPYRLDTTRPVKTVFTSNRKSDSSLAEAITRQASKQTYYTIKFLVDRPLVADAYRAYAYFRWVDDYLDQEELARPERIAFVERQRTIIERTYRGEQFSNLAVEERLVVDLISNDSGRSVGLRAYIDNMMAVMAFDANRRGGMISQAELVVYTRWLATAVTEALHHFIGHNCAAPQDETRYTAVTAAHITHMLRDTIEDIAAGYYNIPVEFLVEHGIEPENVNEAAYRLWVESQVNLARHYFQVGRTCLARVENRRCRIAGYAYIARFEVVLDAIEGDGFVLRADYLERKTKRAALKMGWAALSQAFKRPQKVETLTVIEPRLAKETIS